MTDEQILKKAIEKAVENGWTSYGEDWHPDAFKFLIKQKKHYWIIFSHDFAKAFWGKWKYLYHISRMVQEKEPLQYLKKFL